MIIISEANTMNGAANNANIGKDYVIYYAEFLGAGAYG